MENRIGILPTSKNWLSALLRLPPEVLLEIFYQLDISELLSLRASNHIVHALLYRHEIDIVRNYFKRKLPPRCLTLVPDTNTSSPWTIDHLCEAIRRQRTCERLAVVITNGISERLKSPMSVVMTMHRRQSRTTSSPQNDLDPRLEKRCIEIRPRLVPALLVLYDFFRRFRLAVLRCIRDLQGSMSDEDFSSLTQCLNWDQQEAIESYPQDLMFEAHHVFTILSHIVTSRLNRDDSYADAVRTAFVMGGLDSVERSLRSEDLKRRQASFQLAFGRAMSGGSNSAAAIPPHKLTKTIRHLASAYKNGPAREGGITRSSAAIVAFICSQSVWKPSALAVMQRREIEDPWKGNVYRYIDYILKENAALGDMRLTLRPWDSKTLI